MFSLFIALVLIWMAAAAPECRWNLNLGFMKKKLDAGEAVDILSSEVALTHVKLFDANKKLLAALAASNVKDIVIGIPNVYLRSVLDDNGNKDDNKDDNTDEEDDKDEGKWDDKVYDRIQGFLSKGAKVTIAVGNEPTLPRFKTETFTADLLPVLKKLRRTLESKNLGAVRLTVPFDANVLGVSYPPEDGAFTFDAKSVVGPVAEFLAADKSPFFVNLYPYFARVANPKDVSVEYATLQTSHTTYKGKYYPNMLAAQVAAVRAALLGFNDKLTEQALPIVVGETGWPTSGEANATPELAKIYNNNAVNSGIPLYLFEAFDEKQKAEGSGSGSGLSDDTEGSYGWLTEQGYKKYELQCPPPVPVPCETKFPKEGGEFADLDCPQGKLKSWLRKGDCVKDLKCGVIECPGVDKYTVLQSCLKPKPKPKP